MKVRRWIFLGVWILTLVLISYRGGAVSYGLFFAVSLIPVICLIYLACVYFCFKVYQELESRNVVCDQPVGYYFVLQNDARFAFSGISVRMFSDLSYVEELPGQTEFELLPGETYKYKTRLVCKYRGEYEVGIEDIIITDFLGLFRVHCAVSGTKKAIVVPKLVKLNELKSIADVSALVQWEAQNMSTEYDVVTRDYVAGDPLKQIHWKATAREQKLKVRTKIGEEKQGIALFFDTKRYDEDRKKYLPLENKILEIVLAVGFSMAEKNIQTSFYYSQRMPKENRVNGMCDFDELYRQIAGIFFEKDENIETLAAEIVQRGALKECVVVFFVLHEINDAILQLTEQFVKINVITVFYVVTDENIEEYCRQSNQWRKIIAISTDAALEEVL